MTTDCWVHAHIRLPRKRKVALLSGGYNAIRSAHNPCSKALLDTS